jgi:RNA polymerase sigma-70 factor, ECF subfamily
MRIPFVGGRADALTDRVLVERVLGGDRDAFEGLVRRYQEGLFRHALGMVGAADAAADLVQESLIQAYVRLASCQDPDRFGSWVFRILRNRCFDYLKNPRRQTVPLETDYAIADGDAALEVERSELLEDVSRALSTLPEAQREAFILKHVEERSYEEMSEMLGASVSALKMRVMRAREALQALLAAGTHPLRTGVSVTADSSQTQEMRNLRIV